LGAEAQPGSFSDVRLLAVAVENVELPARSVSMQLEVGSESRLAVLAGIHDRHLIEISFPQL